MGGEFTPLPGHPDGMDFSVGIKDLLYLVSPVCVGVLFPEMSGFRNWGRWSGPLTLSTEVCVLPSPAGGRVRSVSTVRWVLGPAMPGLVQGTAECLGVSGTVGLAWHLLCPPPACGGVLSLSLQCSLQRPSRRTDLGQFLERR